MAAPPRARDPQSVLFACAMNSVRSPMAESLLQHMFPQGLYVKSADRIHALTAIFAGMASFLTAHFTSGGKGYLGLSPVLIGLLVSAAAALLVLALRPAPQPKELTR